MRNKVSFTSLFLLGFLLGLVLMVVDAKAQQSGSDQPANNKAYSVTSSIEFGVRGVNVDGNADKYRSDLNYQPGFRLFDSSFLMRANEGASGPFDSLLMNSSGWGGDPNGYFRVNMEKSRWYRFDGSVRQFDYFRSLRNFALNQHISDTSVKLGDFDLTLLPQGKIRFKLGYSFDRNNGPSVTTYDYSRDEFPVFAPTRIEGNDYRVGVEASVAGIDLTFQQGFRYLKEDTIYTISAPNAGNNPTNLSVLNTFRRDMPVRGRIPYTRFSLHSLVARRLDFTGRFVYSSSTSRYTMLETLTGRDFSGNNIVLDRYEVNGNAKRPNGIGDVGVTLLATDKLRISNTFRVNSFRINGGDKLREDLLRSRSTPFGDTPLPPVIVDSLTFSLTKYRLFLNTIEADYEFHPRFVGHVGHRYSDRHIERGEITVTPTTPGVLHPEEFDNRTNTAFFGFRARPLDKWTMYFDFERGESDNVFTRVENYDTTNARVRTTFKPAKGLSVNMSLVTRDNNNPVLVLEPTVRPFGADINSRVYTSSVDWTPGPKFSLSSGYTHTHITSEANIILFVNNVKQEGLSRYFVKDNFAFLNLYYQLDPKAGWFFSYRIHRDSGQGDRIAPAPSVLLSSYPLQFQSPETRLSVQVHDRVDLNFGYQWIDYKERFVNQQYYNAHLPYVSLRISFGRRD